MLQEQGRRASDDDRIGHQPALDGLRGVAVAAVLLFHGGFGWASGGYLGVSVFFTLSGFLITRVLLDGQGSGNRLDLRRFYARRIRRLVPASTVTLLAIVVLARSGALPAVPDLRGDLVGAGLQVGNWTQLASGRSYADLFAVGASPVEHFWSLAVEEQIYLTWPLLLLVLARHSRRAVRVGTTSAFVLFAVAAPVIAAGWGADAAYLATPARVAEVLAGAMLAALLDLRRLPAWWRGAGAGAAVVMVIVAALTPADGGWAYHGGLPLFALLSGAVIVGALVEGPVRTALSWRPLVVLGTISYGVYLGHWPIFLLVDAQEPDLDPAMAFLVKGVLAIGAALLSYALVERPIRLGHGDRFTVPLGVGAVAAVVLIATVVAPVGPPSYAPVDEAMAAQVRITPTDDDLGAVADPAGARRRPVRIMVVGDSTGDVVGAGLVEWAAANPGVAQVDVRSLAGCGFVTGGRFDSIADWNREKCERLVHTAIPALYPTTRPDVVVISISLADTWDRSWDDGRELRPTDPAYAARIRTGYDTFFDTAVAAGVPHVVWLRPPVVARFRGDAEESYVDGSQELVEQTVRRAVARHPDVISVLDYRTWFEGTSLPDDPDVRPDSVHLVPAAALQVATDFLGPRLTTIAIDD